MIQIFVQATVQKRVGFQVVDIYKKQTAHFVLQEEPFLALIGWLFAAIGNKTSGVNKAGGMGQ